MRSIVISAASGLVGMLMALTAWHLYNDHKTFHNLLNAIAQQQQSANSPDSRTVR